MKNKLILILIVILISSCSSFKKSKRYHYIANIDDPTIEFKTDFKQDYTQQVFFKLNIDSPEENKCDDFNTVGYYYPIKTILNFPKMVTDLSAKVPINKLVSVKGHYDIGNQSCYAPIQQFRAEKGKNYIVNFELKNNKCKLEIFDKATLQPVKVAVKNCKK